MNRPFSRSLVAALVFCFAFSGAAHGDSGAAASSSTFSVWDLVCDTWNALSKVWQEEGSSLDPFGHPAISNSDEGSSLDPFGRP